VYCMNVVYYKTLRGSPGVSLAVQGWHDLLQRGMTNKTDILLYWDQQVLGATPENKSDPVGVLVYNSPDAYHDTCWFISLSYVIPRYRQRGVYRSLWGTLVSRAIVLGVPCIKGAVSVRNTEMQLVMQKVGRTEEYHGYVYDVLCLPQRD